MGGTAPVAPEKVIIAMVTWHLVIGVGEAVITAVVVASVVGIRPDLVYGARSALRARTLVIRELAPAEEAG